MYLENIIFYIYIVIWQMLLSKSTYKLDQTGHRESNNMQVLWQVSFSLAQCT